MVKSPGLVRNESGTPVVYLKTEAVIIKKVNDIVVLLKLTSNVRAFQKYMSRLNDTAMVISLRFCTIHLRRRTY